MNRHLVKIVGGRLVALALLVGLFYAVSWMPLRVALRDGATRVLRAAGEATVIGTHDGAPAIWVRNKRFYLTADCTYIDLVLVLVPFLWQLDAKPRRNFLRLAAFALVVSAVNFVRVCACLYFHARGASWFLAHDLPDYVLYYPVLTATILWTLRRDLHRSRRPDLHSTARGLAATVAGSSCAAGT